MNHPHVLAYCRKGETEDALVLLNLSRLPQSLHIPDEMMREGNSVLSNYDVRPLEREMRLKPFEAQLYFTLHF